MKFVFNSIILLCAFAQVSAQLTCNQCTESSKESCTQEQTCGAVDTRCMAVRWAGNEVGSQYTYTMRCATEDECSDRGKTVFCDGKSSCEVKCCDGSNCDPFQKPPNYIQTPERTFYCHQCRRERLGSCLKTDQKCDDDQNACISLLLEGGNNQKVYTKRCARKNECTEPETDRLCAEEIEQAEQKTCRPSCCYFDLCNKTTMKTVSLFVITVLVALSIAALN